ncbi:hypothetical protein [Streptomyces sp. NPDC015131]|uniref:hypothetical protein n=1 Tax=Streptomyces sp. NPDC015131 TaxID=3364941 RepID=UPI0037021F53
MRKAIGVSAAPAGPKAWGRAAAAAGVVLLVAGCGGGGTEKETGAVKPSTGASAPAGAGAGAEADAALDAAAVTREIQAAATGAGFTQKPSKDDVPAGLRPCMVSWQADGEKATDSRKSFDTTVAALGKAGWKQAQSFDQKGSVIMSLDKSGWTLKASHHGQAGTFVIVSFIATDNGPKCAALFKEDLEKSKQQQ